jgi:2-polyprenyl-3-methyl-5-hydroxy-6-metoxy-1,4-benzoquinol methylase
MSTTVPPAKAGDEILETKDPVNQVVISLRDSIGNAPLGLMTNLTWHEDPRRLGFSLARYKFVSKMLSGRQSVLEVGCGDGFCSRVVQQEVGRLTVTDFDPLFIADIEQRMDERWKLEARVHDICSGPVPGIFDAAYSLDVLEHISKEREGEFLDNIKSSLTEHGVLIIGMPSLESQAHASAASRAGHINCKTGSDLKQLLEVHFHNVFLFSMNDEVVHTGYSKMAHYLIALAVAKR